MLGSAMILGHTIPVFDMAAAEHSPIEILVSDIKMLGLDGYQLVFELRDNPQIANAQVILHVSLSCEISVSQAHDVGANEALTQFDTHQLIDVMLGGANLAATKV